MPFPNSSPLEVELNIMIIRHLQNLLPELFLVEDSINTWQSAI